MIDQGTIDRIVNAAEIVDVVSQFVTLKRRGVNYVGLCPFHTDKTPSFYVSPSKNICKCFACGEGGTAVHFIMKHEQLSYYEALKFLARKYSIEVEEREFTDEQKKAYNERESLFILNEHACDYFSSILHNHAEGVSLGMSYFKERGFRQDIITKFRLGYCLEQRDAFTQDALKNGFNKDFLVKTGLTIEGENNYLADRFRGRVMFPVLSLSGKVVAFGGRILNRNEKVGKYVNSPESEIYHKSNELYGIYWAKQAITKQNCCYLVEGYTDVISMHQAGIENVVASSGTALTHGQIRLIRRFTPNITVLYDGDAAGIKAAVRGIDLLLEEGMNVKVLLLPDGEDPDSFAKKQSATDFTNYIAKHETDFIRFKTQLLLEDAGTDPIKRASLISDIVATISVIPNSIIRSVYLKDCSFLLNIDERVLTEAVNKKIMAKAEAEAAPAPQPVQPYNSLLPTEVGNSRPDSNQPSQTTVQLHGIHKYEYAILYYVVRFGMEPLMPDAEVDAESDITTVLDFVKFDLERDGFSFNHPAYAAILDEAIQKSSIPDFDPARYFMAHTDSEVSRIAADLLTDKYILSNIHMKQFGDNLKAEDTPFADEKNLYKLVPRVLIEFKNAHIMMLIKDLKKQLAAMQAKGDWDATIEIMAQLKNLEETKKILSKELGERIIIRY